MTILEKKFLPFVLKVFQHEYGLIPFLGLELEFYVYVSDAFYASDFLHHIKSHILSKFLFIKDIKKEIGLNQYEVVTVFSSNIIALIDELVSFQNYICSLENEDVRIDLNPKPMFNMPGNATHFNFSFYDTKNAVFINSKHHLFSYIISGMYRFMKSSMLYFAPRVESYYRFHYPDIYTPLIANWGFNNRSAAIRIVENKEFRIEHRVCGSDVDFYSVVKVLLLSMVWGLKKKIDIPISQSGIVKYSLGHEQRLPMTFTEAKRYHEELDFGKINDSI